MSNVREGVDYLATTKGIKLNRLSVWQIMEVLKKIPRSAFTRREKKKPRKLGFHLVPCTVELSNQFAEDL